MKESKYDFIIKMGSSPIRKQDNATLNEAMIKISHNLHCVDFKEAVITIKKKIIHKKLDKSRMNGIFVICAELPVKNDERYDIVPNEFYEYSLVLRNCDSDEERIMIRDEDPDSFCEKILEYRNKSLQ